MVRYIKLGSTLLMVLGITSTIGALQHGNDPRLSVQLAITAFAGLVATNLLTATNKPPIKETGVSSW